MAYENYECLKIRIEGGVAFVTIDNPPINLFDRSLFGEINRLGKEIRIDDDILVVVFDSANPEFFIAHGDVSDIQKMPTEVPPKAKTLGPLHRFFELYRTMPKVSIAKIEGRCRGGGSEFVLSLDMRFGAISRAILGQPEVAAGILPGGGGTQRLPRLIGRGRAMEVILGCGDFSAELAEQYGYMNRALPPEELTPFVEKLAYRIASFPAEAIALAKLSVDAAELPTIEGLLEEAHYFNQTLATKAAQKRIAKWLELGDQALDMEFDMEALYDKLADIH